MITMNEREIESNKAIYKTVSIELVGSNFRFVSGDREAVVSGLDDEVDVVEVAEKLGLEPKLVLSSWLKYKNQVITKHKLLQILSSTIKHDTRNKLITFLVMLLTFTEEDQINLAFLAESSSGKSYIPLELAWYFKDNARDDRVLELGYVSPTAFFHDFGEWKVDPNDTRDVEEEKKHKIIEIDLHQKILIFIDQPHDMLLQRLRPLLSHDRKNITAKITDRKEKGGLRTKTVHIRGFPTVIFCSSNFSIKQEERTRLLILSPEVSEEKIRESIKLRIQRESDRESFRKFMESDPNRLLLRSRVRDIAAAGIKHVIIPESLRRKIEQKFFNNHNNLIPRHQRDISRVLALIKAYALLNFRHRQRTEDSILVNEEDVENGFETYEEVGKPNELGISPEIYNIHEKLKDRVEPGIGATRRELQEYYYQIFHKTIGKDRLNSILDTLLSVGLWTEIEDPDDRRRRRFLPTSQPLFISEESGGKINSFWGVGKKQEELPTPSTLFISEENQAKNGGGEGETGKINSVRGVGKFACSRCGQRFETELGLLRHRTSGDCKAKEPKDMKPFHEDVFPTVVEKIETQQPSFLNECGGLKND